MHSPNSVSAAFRTAILTNRSLTADMLDSDLTTLSDAKMADIDTAAERIASAIGAGETIALCSDYDADGWGCCVIFEEMMKLLEYDRYIVTANSRSDGYGISTDFVQRLLDKHPDVTLIVTADNGIQAFDAVAWLAEHNVDCVITDHHPARKDGAVPAGAVAVVDPQRPDDYSGLDSLCGTAVLYCVMLAVLKQFGVPADRASSMLDVVGVATVADVMPMTGINHTLVKMSMAQIASAARPQWAVLAPQLPRDGPTSRDIGFNIAPCINAVSRMTGDIMPAVEAFRSTDVDGVQRLLAMNKERKAVQNERLHDALTSSAQFANGRCLCVEVAACESGIIGLVAGNLCNRYYKPAVVFCLTDELEWQGSGRSVPGVDMNVMLSWVDAQYPGTILRYGGHTQAAGVTVAFTELQRFRAACCEYCNTLDEAVFARPAPMIDYTVTDAGAELPALYEVKRELEPYGNGFPEPQIACRVVPEKVFTICHGEHLMLCSGHTQILVWHGADLLGQHPLSDIAFVDVIGNVDNPNKITADAGQVKITFRQ